MHNNASNSFLRPVNQYDNIKVCTTTHCTFHEMAFFQGRLVDISVSSISTRSVQGLSVPKYFLAFVLATKKTTDTTGLAATKNKSDNSSSEA